MKKWLYYTILLVTLFSFICKKNENISAKEYISGV